MAHDGLLQRFRAYLIKHRFCDESTAGVYARDVGAFLNYWDCRGRALEDMDRKLLNEYIHYLLTDGIPGNAATKKPPTGYSFGTLGRHISAIRAFYISLIAEGYFKRSPIPADWRTRIKSPSPLLVAISHSEVETLIHSVHGSTPLQLRDRATLEILYATGVQASELSNLNLGDADLDGRRILVRRSRNRHRSIPFGKFAYGALSAYLKSGRPELNSRSGADEPVFVNRDGGRLSRKSIHSTVVKYSDEAGLPSRVTPRVLRHSFSRALFQEAMDPFIIQYLLGIESPTSMEQHFRSFDVGRRDCILACHPLSTSDDEATRRAKAVYAEARSEGMNSHAFGDPWRMQSHRLYMVHLQKSRDNKR